MTESLRPLTPEALRNVNTFVYCHHCRRMSFVQPRGWRGHALVYRCRCGGEIVLEPRRT